MKFEVCAVVGVPEMTPVDEARLKPVGSEPLRTLHVYGVTPPVAASVCEYGEPTVPPGSVVVVIWRSAALTTMESAWVSLSGVPWES